MGSDRKEYFITDLYTVSSGLSKPAKDFGEGYPFVSFVDVMYNCFLPNELSQLVKSTESERRKCSVKRGDVFLTRTSETMDALGMSSVAKKDYPEATFNGFTKRLRPNSDSPAHPEYVAYFLRTPQFRNEMMAFSTMSTRASLNNDMIGRLKITLPSLKEQRAIAHILGSLDDKIELNRRMNATLEGMAQALFKSWFVDFDPVIDNAIVAGNPIPEELADRAEVRRAALANGTANREAAKPFPAAFQHTEELGWIPEGWKLAEMTEVAYLNPEAWSSTNHPDRVSYIDLGNVKDGRIDEVIEYDFEVAPSRARRVLREDDTVIGTVRPGNRSFAYIHESNLTGSTGFAVLRPKHPKSRAFIYFCLTQDEVIGYFAHLADGGAYPAIRPDVVGNYLMPLCNSELIDMFDQHCYPMIQKIGRNQRQALSLTKLRDTLLPKLISGELRVPDAEKLAEAALA
jgi:type I restriction enzyme, S subunit